MVQAALLRHQRRKLLRRPVRRPPLTASRPTTIMRCGPKVLPLDPILAAPPVLAAISRATTVALAARLVRKASLRRRVPSPKLRRQRLT